MKYEVDLFYDKDSKESCVIDFIETNDLSLANVVYEYLTHRFDDAVKILNNCNVHLRLNAIDTSDDDHCTVLKELNHIVWGNKS